MVRHVSTYDIRRDEGQHGGVPNTDEQNACTPEDIAMSITEGGTSECNSRHFERARLGSIQTELPRNRHEETEGAKCEDQP